MTTETPDAPTTALWPEADQPQLPPIAFTTERKALLAAFSRTQHAIATDEDASPVLQAWWLAVRDQKLTIHAADNFRVARARVDVLPAPEDAEGVFGIHHREARALLAFLAKGPDELWMEAAGGAWTIHHEDGRLTGRLFHGTPPDWTKVTERDDAAITVSLNARFLADAGKAAEGRSGVVRVEYISEAAPVVFRSTDLDEFVMPVRIGGEA